jgi:hypothetical protein
MCNSRGNHQKDAKYLEEVVFTQAHMCIPSDCNGKSVHGKRGGAAKAGGARPVNGMAPTPSYLDTGPPY